MKWLWTIAVVFFPATLYAQVSKDIGDSRSLQLIRQYFFHQDTWEMPSDSVSGICFFRSERQARKTASFINIPVVDESGKQLGSDGTNQFFLSAFIIKNGRCIGIIKLNQIPDGQYMTVVTDEFNVIYNRYLTHKSCFYFSLKHSDYHFSTVGCPLVKTQ